MNYWLVKSEPEAYAWEKFVSDGGTAWTGNAVLTFKTLIPSVTAASPCSWSAPVLTCSNITVGAGGSRTLSYGATFSSTGTGRVTGSDASAAS